MSALWPLSLTAPIEAVLDHILVELNITDANSAEMAVLKRRWAAQLRTAMVLSFEQLLALPSTYLPRLHLPLLIEAELERLIQMPQIQSGERTTKSNRKQAQQREAPSRTERSRKSSGSNGYSETQIQNEETRIDEESETAKPKFPILSVSLTEAERNLVTSSWNLLNSGTDLCQKVVTEAFGLFIKENTNGKRLLERAYAGVYPVFARMVTFLLRTIDISSAQPIQHQIYQLGGRHAIYGVTMSDFEKFSDCFCKILQKYLPDITLENKIDLKTFDVPALLAAWQKTIQGFGSMLIQAGLPSQHGFCKPLYLLSGERKVSDEGNKTGKKEPREASRGEFWKRCYTKLTLNSLLIYRDQAMTELKAQYPIANVNQVSFPNINDTRFVFELICPKTPFRLTLSARDESDFTELIDELNWRILAHNRAAVPEEEDLEEELVGTVAKARQAKPDKKLKKQEFSPNLKLHSKGAKS